MVVMVVILEEAVEAVLEGILEVVVVMDVYE